MSLLNTDCSSDRGAFFLLMYDKVCILISLELMAGNAEDNSPGTEAVLYVVLRGSLID